jgi:uncharacterized protein (TIGR00725 family)
VKQKAKVVSVIGSSICMAEERQLAEQVGFLLAKRGVVIVCGGGGGVMEAACRGAHKAGGTTIGLLPGLDAGSGNPYLTISLPTNLGQARNVIVAQSGEAVIAIGGGYGTLSEIAIALKNARRVVGLATWTGEDAHGGKLEITRAETAEDAVAKALRENM